MSSGDHEKERDVKPEQRRVPFEAMPTNHYLSTLSSDEQDAQSGGGQPDDAPGNNSGAQSGEKDTGDES